MKTGRPARRVRVDSHRDRAAPEASAPVRQPVRAASALARPILVPGGGVRSRNFGPDAPPKNKRKPPRKDSDRGPKGPIKERPVSKLYDVDEDWRGQDEEPEIDDVAAAAPKRTKRRTNSRHPLTLGVVSHAGRPEP